MKYKLHFISLLILFLFQAVTPLRAQSLKSFSPDPSLYLNELEGFLSSTNKKEAEDFIRSFEPYWSGGKLSAERQRDILSYSNDLLKKRMKPFPDFTNYLKTQMAFADRGGDGQRYSEWKSCLDLVSRGNSKKLGDFLEVCLLMYSENVLYRSPSTEWRTSSADFRLECDSVPRFILSKTDISCRAKGDSSRIAGISGVYEPLRSYFSGNGGRVDWSRAGLEPSSVYADLKRVEIDLSGSDYRADSVTFYHKKYFSQSLPGVLLEKNMANVTEDNVSYPRFQSYAMGLNIRELIPDAEYRGGFALHGNRMIGAGTKEERAELIFKRNNKAFLIARSRSFIIRPDRISSENAAVTFFFEKDSIFHPALEFKYNNKEKELSLFRSQNSGISMPFFNSFHQMDIYVDAISWKIKDPLMELRMISGAGESKMILESSALYTDERYQKIQGIADVSPLYTVKKYAETNGRDIFAPDLAKYMKVSEQQARSLLIFLANKGFVSYDFETDVATINEKLHYYLAARSNKTDYDKIEIQSQISALPNATLNLLNFDLDLEGVPRILFSDSQQVWIVPVEQKIKLRKNRDMEFSGRVHAGRSDFFGRNFKFSYENFHFDLPDIDSLRLKVVNEAELDENGNPKTYTLRNSLENVSGFLHIDSMINKSSRRNYPPYPYFRSTKESYVYYDRSSIQDGAYSRDNFYYQVKPFVLDSLDKFAAAGLQFDGKLVSAGIFPELNEDLVMREDYSLGFKTETPAEGLPMYGGKGKFFSTVDLSNEGLRGDGKLAFLSSETRSDQFIFLPERTRADSAEFSLRSETVAGVAFPDAQGKRISLDWKARSDSMMIGKGVEDIRLYGDSVALDGNLVLTSKQLWGAGLARFNISELNSKQLRFNQDKYGADTSDFNLTSNEAGVFALSMKNIRSEINMKERKGEFFSHNPGDFIRFPFNQYLCYLASFQWYIDKQEVALGDKSTTKGQTKISGSEFLSTHPFQDSLRWKAETATYNLVEYHIKAQGVKEILVADASVQPNDTALVVVEKDAYMRPLYDAVIVANTSTKHHTIRESQVLINGRQNYEASGKYSYTDQAGIKHLIGLDRIAVDTSRQTYASGLIPDSSNFQLSKQIQYKGKIHIAAANPLVNFEGFARVNHQCSDKLKSEWFGFRSDINPDGVKIPIDKPRNENLEKLSVSLAISGDSTGFYPNFLSAKRRDSDTEVIRAKGLLSYKAEQKQYWVEPEPVLAEEGRKKKEQATDSLVYGKIAIDDARCLFKGQGPVNLGVGLGQMDLNTAGEVLFNLNNDSVRFDLVAGINFFFSEVALKAMADALLSNPTLPATNDNREVWTQAMNSLIGVDETQKLVSEVSLYGNPKKIPEGLSQSIVLNDVKLYWDQQVQAYRSVGNLGIGFIQKIPVGRSVKGHLEILRRKGGEVFNLYLESDNATWWYFNYSRGIMQAISSDLSFNDAIANLKPDKRVAETKGNAPPYEYMLSTDRKKAEFLRRLKGD